MKAAPFNGIRSNPDTPVDPLGNLGQVIRQSAPVKPDTVRPFEQGNHGADGKLIADHSKALDSIAETLRKKSTRDEQTCDFGEFGGYVESLLGCI